MFAVTNLLMHLFITTMNKIWWWNHDESMENENRPYHRYIHTHIHTYIHKVVNWRKLTCMLVLCYNSWVAAVRSIQSRKFPIRIIILCSVLSFCNHSISDCGKIYHVTNQFKLISKYIIQHFNPDCSPEYIKQIIAKVIVIW